MDSLVEVIRQCVIEMGLDTDFTVAYVLGKITVKFKEYPNMGVTIDADKQLVWSGRQLLDEIFSKFDVDDAQTKAFMAMAEE